MSAKHHGTSIIMEKGLIHGLKPIAYNVTMATVTDALQFSWSYMLLLSSFRKYNCLLPGVICCCHGNHCGTYTMPKASCYRLQTCYVATVIKTVRYQGPKLAGPRRQMRLKIHLAPSVLLKVALVAI